MLLNTWNELLELLWGSSHQNVDSLTALILLLILIVLIFKKGGRK